MSTEFHNTGHGTSHPANGEPRHDTVAYESRDVQVNTIYWYLFSLAVATVLAFGSAVIILRVTTRMLVATDAPMLPMRKEMTEQQRMARAYPPEPRLQGVPGHPNDGQQDMRDKLREDTEANEQLRWIDQASGIAQIPVSEAMKLIVERGVHGSATSGKSAESTKQAAAIGTATAGKTN
jgi:hypothetical protein